MKIIATAKIDGPEAKGTAELIRNNNSLLLRFAKGFWVETGAPDVTVALSPNPLGKIDIKNTDIGRYEYSKAVNEFTVPLTPDLFKNNIVVVYCKQYQAYFGHGALSFIGE